MAIIDLIEYVDEYSNEIVHRIPEDGSGEFRLGSQCVVRESQRAVFVRDGKALDILLPGRHTLSTANIPLLTGIIGLPFGSKSPFRAEVYFVNMREFTDLKWGTQQPVVFRDREFGMVQLRVFGSYSMRVKDPQRFVNQIVGTRASYTTDHIEGFLRGVIVNEFTDMLGETVTTLLDVPAMTMDLATTAQHALADDFDRLGLDLRTFQIGAITAPDEVQERINERTGMGVIGDMRAYTQFRTAQAIGNMGDGEGGSLTEGAGLGAGLGLGMAMGEAIRGAMQGGQERVSSASAGPTGGFCPNCGQAIPAGAKFCPNCGHNLAATTTCPTCGTVNPAGAKFCQECGASLSGS